jgi:KinB signaling pathway activation protein
VTSRNWVKLFLTTLLIGAITAGIAGFIVRWEEFEPLFTNFDLVGIITTFFWLMGMGLLFSVLSQMGFFAYLTVHRFGLGIFKSVTLWNRVQLVLIAFILFDLVYFRYSVFAEKGDSYLPYLATAIGVFLFGLIIAWQKTKQTNKAAFVPALFFMVVISIIEWMPAIRVNNQSWLYFMLIPLLVCNTYQLLMLHKINENSELQRKTIETRKMEKGKKQKQK